MKYRLACMIFAALAAWADVSAQNVADPKERLKNSVTRMDNGDIMVPFSLDFPQKVKEIVPGRHHYMYDLWLPYLLYFDQNVKWDEFNAALPEKDNSWDDRDVMFEYLKGSVKLNCKLSKKATPRSLAQSIDKGMPLLVRIEKFNASYEAMISRRSRMRERIRSKEQREELLSTFTFNLSKARLYGLHHPKVLIGYNPETKEYCVKMGRTTNIWYTEAEMKKILREVHVVSIP